MADLTVAGIVTPSLDDSQGFILTSEGRRLGLAMASKPIRRLTASRALEQLVARAAQVAADAEYLFQVKSLVVFGSYMTDKDPISDVDVALALEPKLTRNTAAYDAAVKMVIDQAFASGRRFGNIIEELMWPRRKTELFLKNKSRSLQITDGESPEMIALVTQGPHRQVYP
jgi:predicted nucleotidyltransferase